MLNTHNTSYFTYITIIEITWSTMYLLFFIISWTDVLIGNQETLRLFYNDESSTFSGDLYEN